MTRLPGRLAMLAVLALAGCAPWRTTEPVQPTTYQLPGYRDPQAVGNLRRVAVLPVLVYHAALLRLWDARWTTAYPNGEYAQYVADYLAADKGYDALPVRLDAQDHWRSDTLKPNPPDTWQSLQAEWTAATTEEAMAMAASRIGRALNGDGIVVAWWCDGRIEHGLGMLNLPLMNLPLFYGMVATSAEAVIYATASGRKVWSHRLPGADMPDNAPVPSLDHLLGDLENAIPAAVVQ